VFTMLIDLVMFGDPPDPVGLIGAGLVIAGGTWVVLVGRSQPPAPPAIVVRPAERFAPESAPVIGEPAI